MRPVNESAPVEIVALAGSLRAGSFARSLLRAAGRQCPAGVRLTVWDGLGQVPPFNQDLEGGPAPVAVSELRALIERSWALLLVTPEYNTSMPGALKNALDWASRPYGASVLTGKPVAAIGTSPSPRGGASALSDLRRVLTAIGADVVEADLAIPSVHSRFDREGLISDPELADQVTQLIFKVARYPAARGPASGEPDRETTGMDPREAA